MKQALISARRPQATYHLGVLTGSLLEVLLSAAIARVARVSAFAGNAQVSEGLEAVPAVLNGRGSPPARGDFLTEEARVKVAVFGLGYVGTVTAACLASNGHDVWGVDVDQAKVGMISGGLSPVQEPGLSDLVRDGVQAGRLHATTSPAVALERADISLVCVGTPSSAQGDANLAYIERAVCDIARELGQVTPPTSKFHSVVIRSTVPPGTVEGLVSRLIGEANIDPEHVNVGAGMCPEFLREGCGVADFYAPPFVVVGTQHVRVVRTVEAMLGFLDLPVQAVETKTAEALKYTCNAFHAIKVSFANEVGRLFRFLDVDAREVMKLLCQDTTLNIAPTYLRPGFAFGGSCLPKDLRAMLYLARTHSTDLPLLAGALSTNEMCIREIVDRVISSGARTVAILGLSFKMNSDDLRESPYVELAERLIGKGYEVRIYDAIVNPSSLVGTNKTYVESKMPHLRSLLTDDPAAAVKGADIVVVATWEESVVDVLLATPPPLIIDLNGRLGDRVEELPAYSGAAW